MRKRRRKTGIFLLGALAVAAFIVFSLGSLPFLAKPASIDTEIQPLLQAAAPAAIEAAAPAEAPAAIEAIPPSPTPTAGPLIMNYIVLPGDTLSELAERYDTTVEKLREYNNGLEPTRLVSGEMIKVPDLAALRGARRPRFDWPLFGPITTPFGERGASWVGGVHPGLDVGGYMGDTVRTAGEGVIVETGTDGMGRGYGTYVLIYHSANWYTLYTHLSKVYHGAGRELHRSDFIGEVGMTGFADGPHLHFEVWHDGERLDPIQFLP